MLLVIKSEALIFPEWLIAEIVIPSGVTNQNPLPVAIQSLHITVAMISNSSSSASVERSKVADP
jgi:hypothetical protein